MTNEELKIKITELLPAATFEESGEWINVNVEPQNWLSIAQQLRSDDALFFDYLFCLTCIDWKTHLTMVYHLSSTRYRQNMVI
ncbi:MAG: NADH-quinone oxidoreductase subunit C, partial [Chitinophagaceae bacterium]|nr:NADH-quinone oxidoreductase subunit C [Chitinophagaceae bacterium]